MAAESMHCSALKHIFSIVGEDEEKQKRVHDHAHGEWTQLAPQHPEVA
jgi:hypothetical protein